MSVQKGLGLNVKASAPTEQQFGWQPALQERAAEWDEDWDKFDDEGFVSVQDIMDDGVGGTSTGKPSASWDESSPFGDHDAFASPKKAAPTVEVLKEEHTSADLGSPRAESESGRSGLESPSHDVSTLSSHAVEKGSHDKPTNTSKASQREVFTPSATSTTMEFAQLSIFLSFILVVACVQADSSIDSIATSSEIFTESDDSHTLYSGCGSRKCTSDEHLEPDSTQEVSNMLHQLNAAGRPFKLRATRRGYHSPNGFVCSGTTSDAKFATGQNKGPLNGESGTHSVTLLMHRMNRFLAADHARHRLTVEAGMTLQDLADATVQHGMSVPPAVLPLYGNLTVSGVLAVSAHGSGAGVDSSLGDLVTKVKWVNGKGDIITSDSADSTGLSQIRGLIGGLGLLGVLCEVTFQLLPAGALAEVEIWTKDDSTIASDIKHQLQSKTPQSLYFWRPDLQYYRAYSFKVLKSGDVPVYPYYPRGRGALLLPVPEIVAKQSGQVIAASQADIDDSSPAADVLNAGICALSNGIMGLPIFTDGEGNFVENATIPTSYAMISEECEPNCVWTQKFFASTLEDNEFTLRFSDIDEWVKDVKAIVKGEEEERRKQLDRRYGKSKVQACMSPGFFWLRFGKPTENLLDIPSGMDEPILYAMMTFFTSVVTPNAPPKHDHIQEVIEQLSLCKYRARTHYGKNTDRVFTNEQCPVLDNFPEHNLAKMRKLQEQHDPQKVFESELLSRVLEKRGPIYEDKCTMTHRCYCKEDSHCADGFKCQPSVAFPEYKACKVQFPSHQEIPRKDEL